jgi:hypothetical protein
MQDKRPYDDVLAAPGVGGRGRVYTSSMERPARDGAIGHRVVAFEHRDLSRRALTASMAAQSIVTAANRRWDSPAKIKFAPDSPLEGTGFEPSVPLLRKALLGVANRRRRHERRSHLQVQVRNGNACLEWLPIAFPFAEGPRVRILLPPADGQSLHTILLDQKKLQSLYGLSSTPRLRIVRTAATMRTHRYRRSTLTLCDR